MRATAQRRLDSGNGGSSASAATGNGRHALEGAQSAGFLVGAHLSADRAPHLVGGGGLGLRRSELLEPGGHDADCRRQLLQLDARAGARAAEDDRRLLARLRQGERSFYVAIHGARFLARE